MKSVEFCYWLQGFFELSNVSQLNSEQTQTIRRHLNMVFIHEIDKSYSEYQKYEETFDSNTADCSNGISASSSS